MSKEKVCLDFDGVISLYEGKFETNRLGHPIDGAFEFIAKLQDRGYEVVVFSSRPAYLIEEWLREFDFPELQVTNQKVSAVLYIDDRAYRFDGDFDSSLEALDLQPWWKI